MKGLRLSGSAVQPILQGDRVGRRRRRGGGGGRRRRRPPQAGDQRQGSRQHDQRDPLRRRSSPESLPHLPLGEPCQNDLVSAQAWYTVRPDDARGQGPAVTARKIVNIKDVARLAGVSPTTVSHALGGARPVSAATRRRVRDAAERLGYRPHPGARSLKAGGTGVLALCAANVTSRRAVLRRSGVLLQAHQGRDRGQRYGSGSRSWSCPSRQCGRVLGPAAARRRDRRRPRRRRPRPPRAARPARPLRDHRAATPTRPDEGCWVDGDADAATRLFLDHLAARGARRHRRRHLDDLRLLDAGRACTPTTPGARSAAAGRGSRSYPKTTRRRCARPRRGCSRRPAAGRRAAASTSCRRSACCGVAAELGIDVPGDLMVAAPSDFGLGATSSPPMTTLDYHAEEHGPRGGEAAGASWCAARRPPEPRRVLPVSLIERESTRRR